MRDYLSKTQPVSPAARNSWIRYLAPCYLGLFAWFGYAQDLSGGTIDHAPFGLLFSAVLLAGLLSHFLFFRIPAVIGMQTGYPTGILGSSTFGSRGGQLVPGLLLGFVLAALLGATGYHAGRAVTVGLELEGGAADVATIAVAVLWSFGFAFAARFGIKAVAAASLLLAGLPLLVAILGLSSAQEGIAEHGLDLPEPFAAFTYTIHLVTAFFATAAAASPSLARYCGSKKDVQFGGLFGIVFPACLFAFVAMATVAGARYLNPGLEGFGYLEAAAAVTGRFAPAVCAGLLLGSAPAGMFIGWMASDSFAVMAPKLSRMAGGLVVGSVASVTAASGLAANLPLFFTIAAALTAPVCGIMAADYWQHDKRWPHTRPGVNYAGYVAWLLGIGVGLVPLLPLPAHILAVTHPAAVYSCIAGFAGYIVLGNLGLKPYRKHRRRRVRTVDFGDEDPGHAAARIRPEPEPSEGGCQSSSQAGDGGPESEPRPRPEA